MSKKRSDRRKKYFYSKESYKCDFLVPGTTTPDSIKQKIVVKTTK